MKNIPITCKSDKLLPISQLENFQGKLKAIDEQSFNKLKESIVKYGFSFPIFVWGKKILDGHQRLAAVKRLIDDGYSIKGDKLPIVDIIAKSEQEAAEKLLLINSRYARIDQSGFDAFIADFEIDLADFSGLLEIPEIEFDFDVAGSGYDGNTDPDEVPDVQPDIVSKRGDIWILGKHRLMCGDSTLIDDVERLMAGGKADLIFTSPPYDNQRTYNLEVKINWPELMSGVFGNLICTDDCQVLVNLGLIHKDKEVYCYWNSFIDFMRDSGWRFFGWYVWDKMNIIPGDCHGRLMIRHEWILHFNKKSIELKKIIDCKEGGKIITHSSIRQKDGTLKKMACLGKKYNDKKVIESVINNYPELAGQKFDHPAKYPVGLVEQFIETFPNDLIFEPFSGSGTTIIAAQKTNRRCFAMEISERYVDVAVRRWQDFTGQDAILESTGETFNDRPTYKR